MAVNTTAVAPTLSAIEPIAIPATVGARRNWRTACRMSWKIEVKPGW